MLSLGLIVFVSALQAALAAPTLEYVGVGFCQDKDGKFYDAAVLYSQTLDSCDSACVADSFCVGFDFWTTNSVCNLRFSDGTVPAGKYSTTSTSSDGKGEIQSSNNSANYVCHRKLIPPTPSPTNAPTASPTTSAPTSSPTPSCDSRVMLVTDRTYIRQARETVDTVLQFSKDFVNNLAFGGASLGHINLKQHTIAEIIDIEDGMATNQTGWQEYLDNQGGGFLHSATQFWLLYSTIADKVSETGKKSYIVLVTDGVLQMRETLERHVELKGHMKNRLGADHPEIICVRVRVGYTSLYLSKICDKIIFDGFESKSLSTHAQELASYVCDIS